MAAPFVPKDALEKVRNVARAKGLRLWVDHQARIAGKPFVCLLRNGCTLAEFSDYKAALLWLGEVTK